MTDGETIGKRIKRERLQRSMTQRELAALIGVGAPHVSKVEAGRENPSVEILNKIALVFNCEFEELLLVARRLPTELLDQFAVNPRRSLEFLRTMKVDDD